MRKSEEFQNYVAHDLLGDTPGITSRAMSGGYGIYEDLKRREFQFTDLIPVGASMLE